MLKVAFISLVFIAFCASFALAWPRHGAPVGGGPITPGLHLGAYGSTTASGWTTIGPSNGTLASTATTNIIYVSDSLGNDDRDGSTPTFIDDNNTVQFQVTSAHAFTSDIYKDFVSGQSCTVAVTINPSTFIQCASRTGSTFSASGTLTKQSGTGDATIAYSSFTLGIHGPVKTIIKAIGGNGPAAYNLDHNSPTTGDGTGLGTRGNWRTAGGVGSAFALRGGMPDWVLLRMGDTFTGQAIETAFDGASDNFGKSGFSEQEPMVISSYDEAVPVTTPDLGSGLRARPIILVPSATNAYAAMQGAGNFHAFSGRDGIHVQGISAGHNLVIMGIDFYSYQADPGNGAYVMAANTIGNGGIHAPSGSSGILIEDVHVRWFQLGIGVDVGNFDLVIRRSQADHCYTSPNNIGHTIGTAIDDVQSAGGSIWSGFSYEENVLDLCGWTDSTFTMGDSRSRNAYLQWNAVAGNRRGNTSTRSASENIQFRNGGTIADNFTYGGSFAFDVGHEEGDPALTSSTTVTNNVVLTTGTPLGAGLGQGINFYNSNNVTASGNIVAHMDPAVGINAVFAETNAYDGGTSFMNETANGTGGTLGYWPCIGGANFTGGHGTNVSNYTIHVGAGGSLDDANPIFVDEPFTGQTFLLGDVLTPVANYPSINTAGTSITAAGTGGTAGDYGFTFDPHGCRINPANSTQATSAGIALTNFSGSMAGSGARANFNMNDFTSVTRTLNVGTGFYEATGAVPTNTNFIGVGFGNSTYTTTITVYGAVPSAYNGTWQLAASGTGQSQIVWSLATAVDPGPVTTPGHVIAYQITKTGVSYQAGDVLTALSTDIGGQTGLRITVGSISHLTGWQLTVASLTTAGVHGLTWTGNTIFNWPDGGPPVSGDNSGSHDSPGGILGSGAANTWTGNSICTGAQFTGVITATNTLSTSALVQGTIAIGQNLAGAGVTANTTITGGSGTSWTVSPNQTASSTPMYSYTCTPTKVYAHPERNISTYAASLGLTATIGGYMTAALANAKWNWNPALTANNGINPYIRLGFQ